MGAPYIYIYDISRLRVNYAYVSILVLFINFVSENIPCELLGIHCGQDYISVTDLP